VILQSPTLERDLRHKLRPMRKKLPLLALTIFIADILVYCIAFWGALHTHGAIAWLCGWAEAASMAMLFVVGHDACHGSLTANPVWNRWIGTLAFLPTLTPFSAWELGHNQTHHVYTNLRTQDYVWRPFTKREFDALPRWRRGLERLYRSLPGIGLYYLVEVWWRRLFFACEGPDGRLRRRDLHNSLLCSVFLLAVSAIAFRTGGWPAVATAVLWPFLAWNWVMSWAIFEHHTHPDVPWFDNPEAWRNAQAQTRCTVHLVLPKILDAILHRIMQHTAHHLDVTVPLYGLVEAQRALEAEPAVGIVVYRWTPFTTLQHLRICKLYDFERRCWTGFDGVPRR
jgi:acyl-lipid omega-6 desaturase (Delta-12 desaturase)